IKIKAALSSIWRQPEGFIDYEGSAQLIRRASVVATIFWKFWNHRNIQIFESIAGTPDLILSSILGLIQEYHQHHPP
ncbi:hypothetical protein PIB30_099984, partial [Stylosanthes scabra]|nr:hypothetical protein [Stylosanthes scabra]